MQDALVLLGRDVTSKDFVDRLAPLERQAAVQLGEAFLKDAISTATNVHVDVWCSTERDDEFTKSLLPDDVRVFMRNDPDYAQRLINVADTLFSKGYRRVLMVPMDCPTIDSQYLMTAFEALQGSDAVIGPSTNGAYVLIGLSKPIPRLFLEIDMGTTDVLRQTLIRAKELDLHMNVVPPRRGIDSLKDLQQAFANGELDHAKNLLAAAPAGSV